MRRLKTSFMHGVLDKLNEDQVRALESLMTRARTAEESAASGKA